VSDRFVPSSLAYQGVGRGLGVAEVEQLNELATAGLVPDLVVVLDLAPDVARERLLAARSRPDGDRRDRLEREDDAFALAVHEAYRDLARSRGWALVDAAGAVDDVEVAVWGVVQEHLAP
jgi:dTMP kinase